MVGGLAADCCFGGCWSLGVEVAVAVDVACVGFSIRRVLEEEVEDVEVGFALEDAACVAALEGRCSVMYAALVGLEDLARVSSSCGSSACGSSSCGISTWCCSELWCWRFSVPAVKTLLAMSLMNSSTW